MDAARAHHWFAELVGLDIDGWKLDALLGHGKSAIVARGAKHDGSAAAIKIFEPELVERFGAEVQLARIQREVSLVGHAIPNLIQILDGGQSGSLLYVAMEFLPPSWMRLSDRLLDVPRDRIWPIIAAIAEAAHALESVNIAHRDIKPENIMVTEDFGQLKLLDLGVMRPIGAASLTDEVSRPFIGTLRYSSPEYLMREEEDSVEGWRATTFYQLGGVLHDLIMRKPLFADYSEPFARLTRAVQEQQPTVEAPDVHIDLLLLCRNALLKDPKVRLECVSWSHFAVPAASSLPTAEAARERVKKRMLVGRQSAAATVGQEQMARLGDQIKYMAAESLKSAVRETMAVDEFPVFQVVNRESSSPDSARFVLRFGPSPEHSIKQVVEIEFEVSIVDAVQRVCRVNCLGPHGAGGPTTHELFIGVFEHESIRVAVRDQLYLLMDRIQEA